MKNYLIYWFNSILLMIILMILIMISVAFFTLFERKIMGLFHNRKAPNKMFLIGLSQPFNDAMKLLSKEFFFPNKINFYFYFFSPMLMMMLSLMIWMLYPFYTYMMNMSNSILLMLSLISMGIYGMIISGWASNSMFSLIGAIRSIAQSISYEVIFSLSLLTFMLLINSLNIMKISSLVKNNLYLILMNLPLIMILFCSMIAEINRTPFDLSEGESELVSGFNIEYSSSNFTMIFLAEYSKLMFMMLIFNLIFFSSNYLSIMFYWMNILFLFIITWIRMTFPRMRYDKLMILCWMILLPLNLFFFMIYLIMKYFIDLFLMLN